MSGLGAAASRGRTWLGQRLRAFLRGSGPTPEALRRADFYRTFPVGPDDVVFLGDSVTEGAEWHEMFPSVRVRNRGIAEETSADVLVRLDTVLGGAPRKLFVMVGINDILFGGTDRDFLANYRTILTRCATESPETTVHVQSMLPHGGEIEERVDGLNRRLEALAGEMGVTFIPLDGAFRAPDGGIAAGLTPDTTHLTGDGYRRWREVLAPFVES